MKDHDNVDWYVLFAGNIARTHALFCLWLACHRRLATRERLEKFGIIRDNNCYFCIKIESIDHLFNGCNIMKNIWAAILDWIKIGHSSLEWHQELCWLVRSGKGKGTKAGILKLAAAECIYHCWKLQNETCFGNLQSINIVVSNIKEIIIHRGYNYRKYKAHIARILM